MAIHIHFCIKQNNVGTYTQIVAHEKFKYICFMAIDMIKAADLDLGAVCLCHN